MCGTVCGVRINQFGVWNTLASDQYDLNGRTLGPVTVDPSASFYLELQLDCTKLVFNCEFKVEIIYQDEYFKEYDRKTYTVTVGAIGGPAWINPAGGATLTPYKNGYIYIRVYCDGSLITVFSIKIKLAQIEPPTQPSCATVCGVRINQFGIWNTLASDQCDINGKTFGPVTVDPNTSFYLELQIDCTKWFSDCQITVVTIYEDTDHKEYSRKVYNITVGYFGGPGWINPANGATLTPYKDGYLKIQVYCDGTLFSAFYIKIKVEQVEPPTQPSCATVCGVRINQLGAWNTLASDQCDLNGRTLGPVTVDPSTSFYLELQIDCTKWFSDCQITVITTYEDTNHKEYDKKVYNTTVGYFGGATWVNPARGAMLTPYKDGYLKIQVYCDGTLFSVFYIKIKLGQIEPPTQPSCATVCGVRIKQAGDWNTLISNQCDINGSTFGPVTIDPSVSFYLELQLDCTKWTSNCQITVVSTYEDTDHKEYDRKVYNITVGPLGGPEWINPANGAALTPYKDGYLKMQVYCDGVLFSVFYIKIKLGQVPPPPPPPPPPDSNTGTIIVEIDGPEEQLKDVVIYYDSQGTVAQGRTTSIQVELNRTYRVRCSKRGFIFIPLEETVKLTEDKKSVTVKFKMIDQNLLLLGAVGILGIAILLLLLATLIRRK